VPGAGDVDTEIAASTASRGDTGHHPHSRPGDSRGWRRAEVQVELTGLQCEHVLGAAVHLDVGGLQPVLLVRGVPRQQHLFPVGGAADTMGWPTMSAGSSMATMAPSMGASHASVTTRYDAKS